MGFASLMLGRCKETDTEAVAQYRIYLQYHLAMNGAIGGCNPRSVRTSCFDSPTLGVPDIAIGEHALDECETGLECPSSGIVDAASICAGVGWC